MARYPAYVLPENPSPNLQALLAYVSARNSWISNVSGVLSCFHDSLEHRILPQSLMRPVLNKKQYGEYLTGLSVFFQTYQMTIHEVIEDPNGTIVLYATSAGVSASGNPFTNEYMIMFQFIPDEYGALPKITKVKEFVDSVNVKSFFQVERDNAAQRNRGRR